MSTQTQQGLGRPGEYETNHYANNQMSSPELATHGISAKPGAIQFIDVGSDFYPTRRGAEHAKRNHIRQLEALGYTVTLEPVA